MNLTLTYDDIQLVPDYSEVSSRKNISLETQISKNYKIDIPLVASPMDTVCGYEMALSFMKVGGAGCIHRFMTIEDQVHLVKKLFSARIKGGYSGNSPIVAAVGANGDYLQRASELIGAGADVILIDVAHGHHKNVKDAIQNIKAISNEIDVIAGNIATKEAALDLESWGADGLRVGIGGGSLCTTRVKTGFGVPNVTCLQEIIAVAKTPVMADGGIRSSGDAAKALALGASCVMVGSLIAGTEESPGSIIETPQGLYKRYRGAASLETKMTHGQEARNVEGESTMIPYKGGVKYIVEGILDGVRSAFSYAGANSIKEFNPDIVRITSAGQQEAKPHLLR